MEIKYHIAIETIQLLTSSEAVIYQLIPLRKQDKLVYFYGIEGRDYLDITTEIEALYGWHITIEMRPEEEIKRLLLHYYRPDSNAKKYTLPNIGTIASGRGFLMALIAEAFADYSSDIHIEPYEERCRIRLRIDGELTERYVIDRQQYAPLVNQIKILANLDISEKRLPQDGRILYDSGGNKFDVRVSSLPTIYGEKMVLRLLTRHVELLDLSNLGLSEQQYTAYTQAIRRPFGMVLICGPTGSGKSTTLYATLRMLNKTADNILTIEDPIEYTLDGVNQVQLKEDIGLTFTSALRTFLRQDPDIIMLGEIRDAATAQMAVRSSLTGHLLFSTIHTNTAWGAVARLSDMGVHPYLVASTLVMTVAQRLVRLLCQHCKRSIVASCEVRQLIAMANFEIYNEAVGCERCYYTGYSGRRAVYEVIVMDEELSEAIRSGVASVCTQLKARNITSIKSSVVNLFIQGETSLEEVIPLLTH